MFKLDEEQALSETKLVLRAVDEMLCGCKHIAKGSKLLAEESKIIEFTQHLLQHRHEEQPIDEQVYGGFLVSKTQIPQSLPLEEHDTQLISQFMRVLYELLVTDGKV